MPHLKAGRLRGLAVTSAQPSVLLPDLPTVASTVPGFETVALYGLSAPIGTGPAIVARLNRDSNASLASPGMRQRFLDSGLEPMPNSSDQFAHMIEADVGTMRKIVSDLGLAAKR